MCLIVEDKDAVRVLKLDRPDKRNAISQSLAKELISAIRDAEDSPSIHAIVISGDRRAFSSGADRVTGIANSSQGRSLLVDMYEAVTTSTLPMVAAVEGFAVGAGAELAMGSDIRIAGESAVFRFPGAKFGYPVGVARLVGQVGLGSAKDLLFSSRDVEAAEAYRIGLVQRLVPSGEALTTAFDLATLIAARDAATISCLKKQANQYASLIEALSAERIELTSRQ